ncbi:TPA: hypothetical protein O6401_002756, partial [Staphylococcus aureus]|nr:hypothetical protein [Staphylococcus aureus]
YNPGMNDQAEMDNESEDIQHHDIDNNKAIQNDLPDQKVDDKNDKNAVNKEEKHDNRENNSAETKVK